MKTLSHFRELARAVTVSDISTPFLATFDANQSVSDVTEEWAIDICEERNLDPMDQIALVSLEDRVVGWIGYDMLESGKYLRDCMEPVSPDSILSADTSLFDAVRAFTYTSATFFLLLKTNKYIGWISYRDLHKPPLRICLFAMLINLERIMLEILLLNPKYSYNLLPDGRKEYAEKVYKHRKFNYDEQGQPYYSKLLECTTIIDKFTILRRPKSLIEDIPNLKNRRLCKMAERVRNEIAHPGIEEHSSDILSRDKLWSFIDWSETTEEQLNKYLSNRDNN